MESIKQPCIWIQFLVYIIMICSCSCRGAGDSPGPGPGRWEVVIENGGVSAMHMAATIMGTVVMYDYLHFGDSNISLPNGICRATSYGVGHDCSAHSIEYNIATNKVRPLMLSSDTWCSSGAFAADGTLVSTGGWMDGYMSVRKFVPCSTATCDWVDPSPGPGLLNSRWYASNQILPDGRSIVVGGNYTFTYEFVPRKPGEGFYNLTFLQDTSMPGTPYPFTINNLYPFLHLSSDGNLFIFANRDSILLDYQRNVVVRRFPRIPDGPRNYPASASSVMLPLSASDAFRRTEIMICGGAPLDSYNLTIAGIYIDALQSCGRIVITDDPNADWAMENMPAPRVMADMLLLPTGEILIINGAEKGCGGYGQATNPALVPYLYRPNALPGQRFSVLANSTIPRMYHSTAIVLPDGRIFVGGSNTHGNYNFSTITMFPTELRLQAYSPYYLDDSSLMPTIISVLPSSLTYGGTFKVHFSVPTNANNNNNNISISNNNIHFNIYPPTFTTHSFSMHQRLLLLAFATPQLEVVGGGGNIYSALVTAPPTPVAAPPGYYMLFVLNRGIPSAANWIHLS